MINLIMRISIILISVLNVVLLKYYKTQKKNKISKKVMDKNSKITDSEYQYYKYEEKNSYVNEFMLISIYVVAYIVFSYMKFEKITDLIITILSNYLLVFTLNVTFFKNEIKKTGDYIEKNKIYQSEEKKVDSIYDKIFNKNDLPVELYLYMYKKDSIYNILINYVYLGYVIFYVIASVAMYIFC